MNGLSRFIEADNRSAVVVGDLRRGTKAVNVENPQISEAFPEAAIRERAGEFTSRADKVGTQRADINMKHIEVQRWRPPLVDADWHAFCQAVYRGIEGKEWDELHYHCRELSQAAGA